MSSFKTPKNIIVAEKNFVSKLKQRYGSQLSIDICCKRSKPAGRAAVAATDRWDRQTDARPFI